MRHSPLFGFNYGGCIDNGISYYCICCLCALLLHGKRNEEQKKGKKIISAWLFHQTILLPCRKISVISSRDNCFLIRSGTHPQTVRTPSVCLGNSILRLSVKRLSYAATCPQ